MLKFKLTFKKVPVQIERDGKVRQYELREMTAALRDEYLNELRERLEYDKEGRSRGIKNFRDLQTSLLSKCLYDPDGKPVPIDELRQWPGSLISALYSEAEKLNTITEIPGEDELKKS